MAGSFLVPDMAMEYLRIKQADQPGRYFIYNQETGERLFADNDP
jgi:hypothetical protein